MKHNHCLALALCAAALATTTSFAAETVTTDAHAMYKDVAACNADAVGTVVSTKVSKPKGVDHQVLSVVVKLKSGGKKFTSTVDDGPSKPVAKASEFPAGSGFCAIDKV